MNEIIIECGGKYEVHPGAKGGWCVVNSETGEVRCSFSKMDEAVDKATGLNKLAETKETLLEAIETSIRENRSVAVEVECDISEAVAMIDGDVDYNRFEKERNWDVYGTTEDGESFRLTVTAK